MDALAFLPMGLFVLVGVVAWGVAVLGGRHADQAMQRAAPRRRDFRPMVIEGGKSVPLPKMREDVPETRIA